WSRASLWLQGIQRSRSTTFHCSSPKPAGAYRSTKMAMTMSPRAEKARVETYPLGVRRWFQIRPRMGAPLTADRSAGEDVFGLGSLAVQVPVDAGDVVRCGIRVARRGRLGTDEDIDGDGGDVDSLVGEHVAKVEGPVALGGLRRVGGGQHGVRVDRAV